MTKRRESREQAFTLLFEKTVTGDSMEDIIEMAEENGMVLLCTDHTLYCTSGILYSNGLTGVGRRRK